MIVIRGRINLVLVRMARRVRKSRRVRFCAPRLFPDLLLGEHGAELVKRRRREGVADEGHLVGGVTSRKKGTTPEELRENAPQGPDIRGAVVAVATEQHLGRAIPTGYHVLTCGISYIVVCMSWWL